MKIQMFLKEPSCPSQCPANKGKVSGGPGTATRFTLGPTVDTVMVCSRKQHRSPSHISCAMSTVAKDVPTSKLKRSGRMPAFKDRLRPASHILNCNTKNEHSGMGKDLTTSRKTESG